MIKAVLFGSLGSMTDLTDLERQAFNRAFADHGLALRWSRDQYHAAIRRYGRFSGLDSLIPRLGQCDPATVYSDVEMHFRDLIDETEITPDPWFVEAAAMLQRKAVKLALVTGASRQTTLRVLASLFPSCASRVFDIITAAEDDAGQKPSPHIYRFALDELHVGAKNAIALETTRDGLRAAKAAGLYTISLPTGVVAPSELTQADDQRARKLDLNISEFHFRQFQYRPQASARV
ncbi:HAD family hydrolase [Aestuariibius sp. 2305UL40-4]|uniref:HAD family hydrolase n=1 Tax=Aestuariibius violaceus TaxID=3234132 RepID=UPI00345E8BF1